MSANLTKARQSRWRLIWWKSSGCRCRCGRMPEKNTSLLGYTYSLSCRCGGNEINFVVRSNSRQKLKDNWKSLILILPYKHYVQKLHRASDDVHVPLENFDSGRHYGNPLAQWVEARGGHCGGAHGGCS